MRTITLLSVLLSLAPVAPAAAQGALSTDVRSADPLRGVGRTAETWTFAHRRRTISATLTGSAPATFRPIAPVAGPLETTALGFPASGQRASSAGAGRLGALLGSVAGLILGQHLFEGNDLGCDKAEVCYGRLSSGAAVLSGAVVMGGVGYLGGAALGAAGLTEWSDGVPLQTVRIKVAPDGKPGVKLSLSFRI